MRRLLAPDRGRRVALDHEYRHQPAAAASRADLPAVLLRRVRGGLSRVGHVPGFDFPSGYTAFQFVFVLLQASAFGGVFTGFGIARDFEVGLRRRLLLAAPNRRRSSRATPSRRWRGRPIIGVLLTAVALLAGMQVDGGGVDLFGAVRARAARELHGGDVGGGHRPAVAHDPGRPR